MIAQRDAELCAHNKTQLQALGGRAEQAHGGNNRKPSVFFHSQFIGKLLQDKTYDYDKVRKYTKKVSESIRCRSYSVSALLIKINA
jgi:hypothetical protein